MSHAFSFFAVTETWISDFNQNYVDLIAGSNYFVFNVQPKSCRGGGVALLVKSKLTGEPISERILPSLKSSGVKVVFYRQKTHYNCIQATIR